METLRVKLIEEGKYKSMKWKNGFGTTNQIDIQPPGSHFPSEHFNWRLSSATVDGSSMFSMFPGCDRILVVWKGDGLILNETITLRPFEPYTFSGEEIINCEVIGDGCVKDFGLIFNNERFKATLTVESFQFQPSPAKQASLTMTNKLQFVSGVHYLTSISGNFTLQNVTVKQGDTLMIPIGLDNSNTEVTISSNEEIKFFHFILMDKH